LKKKNKEKDIIHLSDCPWLWKGNYKYEKWNQVPIKAMATMHILILCWSKKSMVNEFGSAPSLP